MKNNKYFFFTKIYKYFFIPILKIILYEFKYLLYRKQVNIFSIFRYEKYSHKYIARNNEVSVRLNLFSL